MTKPDGIHSKTLKEIYNNMKSRPLTVPAGSGLIVTDEMKTILAQPGYLSIARGGQKLRELYVDSKFISFLCEYNIQSKCRRKHGFLAC